MNVERQSEDERAKRLMAMGQMAASLAHEIRNPLGSMELYCTLLKKDLRGTAAATTLELAEQIHAGIKVLDRIISNCLQFSRDLVPKKKILHETSELLSELASYARPKAEELGVELTIEEQGGFPVCIDPFLVGQALLNVLLNGIDAASAGTARQVTVTSDRTASACWKVTVKDSGPGIAEGDREKIFDPFFTTKRGGTGLGLAIVHSIVSAHQGSVAVLSRPGEGAAITLEFPGGAIVESEG